MAGFDDVIAQALPYLAVETLQATQDTTWQWGYLITDNDGALVDLTSGFTATLSVRPKGGGTEVVAATVTFPTAGEVLCTVTPATSVGVAVGNYEHELTITRTSDGAQVIAVGAGHSTFQVLRKVS